MQSPILKKGAGILLAIVALVSFAAPASAGNFAQTTYSFSLQPKHGAGRTGQRQKQDNSASYVRLDTKSDGGYVWAWIERTYQNPGVQSTVRTLSPGTSATIPNQAYQLHGAVQVSACLRSDKEHSGFVSISGAWSPDSRP